MKFTNALLFGLLGITMAVPTGFGRAAAINTGVTEIADANNNPGEMKADYRRDAKVEMESGESPGEMKADYRRNVQSQAEAEEQPSDMKADYRREIVSEIVSEEEPGEMKADY